MCMPCEEHSYDVRFLVREFQVHAVLLYMDTRDHYRDCCYDAEFGPLPLPDQASADWLFLHTGSMTVSQHSRKAQAPGVTQFDIFRVSQTFATTNVAWMGPEGTAQLPVNGDIEQLATPCQEGTFRCRRIWEHDPAYSGRRPRRNWAKRPHFTCQDAENKKVLLLLLSAAVLDPIAGMWPETA